MVKAVRDTRIEGQFTAAARPRDWRKAMSDNVAYALLVYTALQIFMTIGAMKNLTAGSSGAGIRSAMNRPRTPRCAAGSAATKASCGCWRSGCRSS